MRKQTEGGPKKIRTRVRMVEPLDLPPGYRQRRFRLTEFGTDDRTAAPGHPRGWYTVARANTTAAFALVDANQQVVAQFSKLPIRSFESGAPIPELEEMLNKLGQEIVHADLEPLRRPQVGYIGWLGTEGHGPSHVQFPVFDGTTTVTTSAKVRYGDVTKEDGVRELEGELTVYRALDGKPTVDSSFVINISPDASNDRIDIQLPIAAATAVVDLITELVAAARRDGLLPKEG